MIVFSGCTKRSRTFSAMIDVKHSSLHQISSSGLWSGLVRMSARRLLLLLLLAAGEDLERLLTVLVVVFAVVVVVHSEISTFQ